MIIKIYFQNWLTIAYERKQQERSMKKSETYCKRDILVDNGIFENLMLETLQNLYMMNIWNWHMTVSEHA